MATATIETTHASYKQQARKWTRCRDVFGGSDEVKAKGTEYLPRLGGQTQAEYDAYVMRALFYNGFGRSVGGLKGVAVAVPPVVKVPDAMTSHMADVTLAGDTLVGMAGSSVEENLIVGRRGLLLDYSDTAKRPYLVAYEAEQIIDWDTTVVDGDTALSYLVLREQYTVRQGFLVDTRTQYRRLHLVDGEAVVEVWRAIEGRQGAAAEFVVVERSTLVRRGEALTFLPFVFIAPTVDNRPDPQKPPLLDLVDVNLSHYRTSADLEHGRHFTGLPQAVIIGANPQDALRIGSSTAWPLPLGGDAKYMEFTGQGLKTLETALDQKERQMAVLGSRMLEGQKTATEAAATVKMRQAGDDATLSSVVGSVEMALTTQLRRWAWWMGATDVLDDASIGVTINKEFSGIDIPIDALSLLAQADKISFQTLYFNLERLGLTRPDVTADQERQQILAEGGLDPSSTGQGPSRDDEDDVTADEGADSEQGAV